MAIRKSVLVAGMLLATLAGTTGAESRRLEPNPITVARWNRFVDDLYALHEQHVSQRDAQASERIGGYHRWPDFFREVTYRERASGRVLSVVQWEREHPTRLHTLEVFIHDAQGRLLRDYYARFLPWGRSAPVQTLINLHAYAEGLHAFRSFDASGKLLYEACRGEHGGRPVRIGLDEDDMYRESLRAEGVLNSAAYGVCFAGLPTTAERYLVPGY